MTRPGTGEQEAVPDPASTAIDPAFRATDSASSATDSASADPEPRSRREIQQALREGRRHPWLRRGTMVVAGGLALLLVLVALAYAKFNSNISQLDVSKLLGQRPENGASADASTNLKPVNILIMGSDTRDLGTNAFGKTKNFQGARSDTTLIVHLSADRQSAVVVSVPRDSMTRAPRDCKDPTGKVEDGPLRQWNANFDQGGPACVIRTVEGNTDIFIDHFVVLNFVGFESMVDAFGSVDVCLPEAVDDPKSKLHLPAGRSRVSGKDALAFVRARYNVGNDGSDLGRINRQQAFLSAMVQEATSKNLLLRPDRLFRFLDAATKSLTTDPELANLNALREIAQSVSGLKSSEIKFVTVPSEPYPPDHNRVQWTKAADALWTSIKEDAPLPGTKKAPGSKPTPTPTATVTSVLTVRPDTITVRIINETGFAGLARQAADDLRIQGFTINASTTGSTPSSGVTVAYSGVNLEKARTVAAAFPGARLVKDSTAGEVVVVSLGAGSPNVIEVPNRIGSTPLVPHTLTASASPTPSPAVTIKARTADTDICSTK